MKKVGQTTQWILGTAFVVIMGVATTLSARLDKQDGRIRAAEIAEASLTVKVDHLKEDTETILTEIRELQDELRKHCAESSLIAWIEEPSGFDEGD